MFVNLILSEKSTERFWRLWRISPNRDVVCSALCSRLVSMALQPKPTIEEKSEYSFLRFVFACQSCCLQRYIRQSGRWAGWVVPESPCLAINSAITTATEFLTTTATTGFAADQKQGRHAPPIKREPNTGIDWWRTLRRNGVSTSTSRSSTNSATGSE